MLCFAQGALCTRVQAVAGGTPTLIDTTNCCVLEGRTSVLTSCLVLLLRTGQLNRYTD